MKPLGNRLISGLLALVALLSAGLILLSTVRGPGIGGDATVYLASARNLIHGPGLGMPDPDGTFRYLSYYPPLFPLSLSVVGLAGIDLVSGARWLNALLFGLMVWLTGFTLGRAARSPLTGLFAAIVLAFSPMAIPAFSWAMTEPLANFLGFLGLAYLLWGLERASRWSYMAVSAVLCGLSIITRYGSLPFLAAGAAGILVLGDLRFTKRLGRAAAYLIIGLVPVLIWETWDYLHSSSLASRILAGGGPGFITALGSFWSDLRLVILGWLAPQSWLDTFLHSGLLQSVLTLFLLALLIVWAVWALRRQRKQPADSLWRLFILLVIFSALYLGFILVTYLGVSPTIDVNQRILLPMHISLIWMAAALGGMTLRKMENARRIGIMMTVAAVLLSGWYASRSVRIVQQNYQEGLGYYNITWQNSQTIQQVNLLPAETILVSNDPTAIYFLTGRLAYTLAEPRQTGPAATFTRYGDGDLTNDRAQRVFKEDGAALVLFGSIIDDLQPLYGERTQERLQALVQGLRTAYTGNDGWIYYYAR